MKNSIFNKSIAFIVFVAALLSLGVHGVEAVGNLDFTPPTPANNANIYHSWSEINMSVTSNNISSYISYCDGTNYSVYDDSLLLYFNFNNNSAIGENSTKAVDISKYGNNGTLLDGVTVSSSGRFGGALRFDGFNDYVNATSPTLTFPNATHMTVMLWVKPARTYQSEPSQWTYFSSLVGKYEFGYQGWDDKVEFKLSNGTAGFSATTASNTVLLKDTWYFFAVTYNATSVALYNATNLVSVVNIPSGTSNRTGGLLGIGASGGGGVWYNGTIDNFRMWNRSLSSQEIYFYAQSDIEKLNANKYNFYNNVSRLADGTHTYYEFANDTDGNSNVSVTKSITVNSNMFNASFTNLIGTVRNDFYGANRQNNYLSGDMLTYGTRINGTGAYLNVTEYRNAWLSSKMNYSREDMEVNRYYSNSTDGSVNYTQWNYNLTIKIETLKWLYANNQRMVYIADYMPTFLADNSSGQCNNLWYCPPTNATQFANIVVDFINQVTEGNATLRSIIDVEVWNEPDGGFLLGNLSKDHITKAGNYSLIYNATYDAIKAAHPEIHVGGIALTSHSGTNMQNMFLSNFSNKTDFYSLHLYSDNANNPNFYNLLTSSVDAIYNTCSTYGANCSRIIISEENIQNTTLLNTTSFSNEYGSRFSLIYYYGLNNYPANISNLIHTFSSPNNYSGSGYLWDMFSGSQLNNKYYASYNTTKNFATYCSGGSQIYTTSIDNTSMYGVSCKLGSLFNNIVTNIGTGTNNISLMYSDDVTYVWNIENKTLYTTDANGIINYGNLASYETATFSAVNTSITFNLTSTGVTLEANGSRIDSGNWTWIASADSTSIHIDSSNDYNCTNWNVVQSGDLTNKNFYYTAHGANDSILANSTFNGTDTIFTMNNIRVIASTGSNNITAADINCTLGSGISSVNYAPVFNQRNPPSNTNWYYVNATGQTTTTPLYNCTNNGSYSGQIQMAINASLVNRIDTCSNTSAYSSAINTTTTYANISITVAPNASIGVWCKRGYNSSSTVPVSWKYNFTIV
jgi:hypothetical protein